MNKETTATVTTVLGAKKRGKGKLSKLEPKPQYIPAFSDPVRELRGLVQQHVALTKASVAIRNMSVDRIFKSDSDPERGKCRLPLDAQMQGVLLAETYKKSAKKLESKMLKCLKQVPIYEHFLSKVYGAGPVICAYLVAYVDPNKATKPSNLRAYCGLAVENGRLARRAAGGKGYNAVLRVRLFQMMSAIWKNAAKSKATTKYLKIWTDYKNRMANSERVVDGKIYAQDGTPITNLGTKIVRSAKGFIHSTGWHKAADVFLEDLYIVWRTLEGLDVWPAYHAAYLGYSHGGKICVNVGKRLTLEEALATVGELGRIGGSDVAFEDIDEADIDAEDLADIDHEAAE